ncbi:MAG TPA: glycosyltransferase family 4 protein [Pirellulales bacterium]
MSLANAAIDYYPSGYSTAGKPLMGREVANEAFLQAFFRHGEVDRFYCLAKAEADFDPFAAACRKLREDRAAVWLPRHEPASPAAPGCLFRGDPVLGELAWRRRQHDERAYSLCGVTHTTCTQAVMDALGGLLTEPLHEWDAIVCTSQAVKATVEQILAGWADYLRGRLGACAPPRVRLPVIPLGVDAAAFDDPHRERTRLAVRRTLGIHAEEFVALYVGRLAFHAKAHPWQLYLSLERAAAHARKSFCLIQMGWFANAEIEAEFKVRARQLCPRVKTLFIDGNRPEFRRRIWPAADVFISLADNIQETFGLTPVEAMAAGLPVVVSDFNGYKDTVRHGIDGFRVPVVTPAAGAGTELARRYERGEDDYDRYIGGVSLCTAIDINACASYLVQLAADSALRTSLGRSGRQRVQNQYDWRHVIRAYQELWHELAGIRRSGVAAEARCDGPSDQFVPQSAWQAPRSSSLSNPLRPDPFALFAGYPTAQFDGAATFVGCAGGERRLVEMYEAPMMNFAPALFATLAECRQLLEFMAGDARSLDELLAAGVLTDLSCLERTLAWLLKGGVLALAPFAKTRPVPCPD